MSSSPTPGTSQQADAHTAEGTEEPQEDRSKFDCNICLDAAQDAVVSMCGHLFCWPCLHQWLETKPGNQVCPVCKSEISSEKVIPIYGKSGEKVDPRNKTPPRPAGQRSEGSPQDRSPNGGDFGFPWNYHPNGVHANVHFSFGFGLFPFSLMASFMNANPAAEQNDPNAEPDAIAQQNELLSNIFLGMGVGFLLWLIIT